MITAYQDTVTPRVGEVVDIVGRMVGSALGGLDVNKAYVLVAADLGPVDEALMAGDVDAVLGGAAVAWWRLRAHGCLPGFVAAVMACTQQGCHQCDGEPGSGAGDMGRSSHCRPNFYWFYGLVVERCGCCRCVGSATVWSCCSCSC